MTIALVDDQVLSSVLRGRPVPALLDRTIFTTGCWYLRLCQAVLRSDATTGRLSRPFLHQPEDRRIRAVQALLELPPSIGLLSLRDLAPLMGGLRREVPLNVLASEALAAAVHLGAEVHLGASSPRLESALLHRGLIHKVHRAADLE